MSEAEPSIEAIMLHRFLEATSAKDILRWHQAEVLKIRSLAMDATRSDCVRWLKAHNHWAAADALLQRPTYEDIRKD